MRTGTYHSFRDRLYAIKTHFLWVFIAFAFPKTHFKNLRFQMLFYCWEKQVCSTDLRQEVGNTRLTRAIIFTKLLLVVCKKDKPTGNTFKGEDKCITENKQNNQKAPKVCFLQSSSCCFHTVCNTEAMSPGLDPTIKSERNTQQNSWCKQLGWILRMYMQIFWVNVHAPLRSWVTRNTHVNGRIWKRMGRKGKGNWLRTSSMTLSVS